MYINFFFLLFGKEGIILVVIEKSVKFENNFGYLFDFVIVNDDILCVMEEFIKVVGSVFKDF